MQKLKFSKNDGISLAVPLRHLVGGRRKEGLTMKMQEIRGRTGLTKWTIRFNTGKVCVPAGYRAVRERLKRGLYPD